MKETKRDLYEKVQRRLISSLLYDNSHILRVLELITEEDIEEPSYSTIFGSIAEISRLGEHISVLSVAENLQTQGLLVKVGGIQELYDIYNEGKSSLADATPEVYARIIKESSAKAKIARVLKDFDKDFKDDSGVPAEQSVSALQSILSENLLRLSDSSTITEFKDDIDSYIDLLDERKRVSEENLNQSNGLQGILTLLPSLNRYTTGWLPGQMITIAAKTGIGKSAFAINCAVAAAQANKSVMIFSLEMSKVQIQDRILSSTTGIPLNKLKQGLPSESEKKLLKNKRKDLENLKIVIDVESEVTVDMIKARALRQAQTKTGLDLIVIDYVQLVSASGSFNNRQEAVSNISRNVKLLAKELEVPIIVLAQLNRGKHKDDEDSMPDIDDIRESGALAQDSDVVILLHRDKSFDDTTPHTLVMLTKNRDGETQKTIRCHSNLECSLFREITRVKELEENDELENFDDGIDLDEEGWDE